MTHPLHSNFQKNSTHLENVPSVPNVDDAVGVSGRRHELLHEGLAVVLDVAVEGVGQHLLGGDGALRGEPLDATGNHVPARLGQGVHGGAAGRGRGSPRRRRERDETREWG